jgi:WD40 repeat protein
MFRLLAALALVVAGLVIVGVVASVGPPPDAEPLPPEPAINLIAYVTADGQVRTIAPDGSNDSRLSPSASGFYTWPTWSPGGESVAFSGVLGESPSEIEVVLFLASVRSGATSRIHTGPIGFAGLLAQDVVHYPIWSPDGRHLAFIASKQEGLTLLLDDRTDDEPPVELLGNGPLWLNWSADSRYLLAHRAEEHLLIDVESKNDSGEYDIATMIPFTDRYRVPAWSPSENSFAYVERDRGDHVIFIGTPDGSKTRVDRAPVNQTALAWSPDGRHLAVHGVDGIINYMGGPVLLGEGFRIYESADVDTDSPTGLVLTDMGVGDVMIAMFWSPDSIRIAYVTAPDTRGVLAWRVYDLLTGESRLLTEFLPSAPQLVLFTFFDQYALSHSPWAPDGRSLVFSGRLGRGVVIVAQATVSQVIVVPVENPAGARVIADGILGFWSPR